MLSLLFIVFFFKYYTCVIFVELILNNVDTDLIEIETREDEFSQNLNEFSVPKFNRNVNKKVKKDQINEKNTSIDKNNDKPYEVQEDSNEHLDDFIEMLQSQDEREKDTEHKDEKKLNKDSKEAPRLNRNGEPITSEPFFNEKNTGMRVIKSPFSSEQELNMRLTSECGQYHKLNELIARAEVIKKKMPNYEWYTIAVMAFKSETKCSSKGNNYIIWQLFDLYNLEREQEISLFLFGNAYKKYWKTSEFELFAIINPSFLDEPNNNRTAAAAAPYGKPNGVPKKKTKKLTLSVRNESQLLHLGTSKDIGICQSYKRTQTGSGEQSSFEASQRCKNLVNLRLVQYCVYHCSTLSKSFKQEKREKGSYAGSSQSMYKPKINFNDLPVRKSFSTTKTTSTTASTSAIDKNKETPKCILNPSSNSSIVIKSAKKEKQFMKEEALLSLNYNPQEDELFSKIPFKQHKASDKELMAKLENKNIDESELKKIRLNALSATITSQNDNSNAVNKEIKSLLSSKMLIPTSANCNSSMGAKKYVEIKNTLEEKSKIQKIEKDDKKAYNLSTMSSHRDIIKQIKKSSEDTKDKKDVIRDVTIDDEKLSNSQFKQKKLDIKASEFLKQHVQSISNQAKISKTQPTSNATTPSINKTKPAFDNFELDIYIGDEKTTKKLMDNSSNSPITKVLGENNKKTSDSSPLLDKPNSADYESKKRKLDEIKSPMSSTDGEKEKKRKLIDDLINIKSKFAKDADNPEKNSHVKAFYDRLEEKESIENRLSSIKKREVRVVTCNICKYTAFSQSDLCKNRQHPITRHMAIQRYFKCKNCNFRTYTIDKLCPVSACMQCGSEKFEQTGLKDEKIETTLIKDAILPD